MHLNHDNPFADRSMIITEEKFVGREGEIFDILTRIKSGNSSSIVGERRIGKSSLLYHIYLTGTERLNDTGHIYRFIFFDGTSPAINQSVPDFCHSLLSKLDIPIEQDEIQQTPLRSLTTLLQSNHETNGPKPVLLIDEFERLTEKNEIFTDTFFESLRSICNSHLLTIVTASHHVLKDLVLTAGLTSEFWNIFSTIKLGEYQEFKGVDEAKLFITKRWKEQLNAASGELEYMHTHTERHPLILQIISYHLYQNRTLELPYPVMEKKIREDLTSHFMNHPEKIKHWVKKKGSRLYTFCIKTLAAIAAIKESIGKIISSSKKDKK